MDKKKALGIIDEWANFYLRLLGEADNLELIEKDVYTILRPKDKKWASIFDVRLEHLENEDLIKTIDEIKEMKQHVWWNQYSDRINKIIFPEGRHEPTPDDDEVFAVMTPDEMPLYQDSILDVKKAVSIDDFKIFNSICFDKTLSSENLFNLYRKDMIQCYIGYTSEKPISVTMVLKNKNIHSLELTSTISEYKKKGFATIVCQTAIKDSFKE